MKTILVLILTLAFGGLVNAQTVNVKANTSLNVGSNLQASTSAGVSANASATGTTMSGNRSASSTQGQSGEEHGTTTASSAVSIAAREIRGWSDNDKADFLLTVKSYAELKSDQDLENFAKGVLVTDENVTAVSSTDSDIEVRYKLPAKFLGIFQSNINAVVDVTFNDKAGKEPEEVKVKFPWYRMFYSLDESTRTDVIEEAVSLSVNAVTKTSASSNVYSRNAITIQLISSILKAIRAEI